MPTPHRRGHQQPSAVPPRADHLREQSDPWKRTAESGNTLTFYFCPTCGSTVYWENEGFPGIVAVAIGNFADPNFPAPTIAVWEETRHPWVSLPPDTLSKPMAKQG